MKINDEPLEAFYPRCLVCGEPISGDGYQIEDAYYCEDCMMGYRIDGTEIAESLRDAAFDRKN